MKKILLVVAIACMATSVFAQKTELRKDELRMLRHEVSVSYGAAVTTNWLDGFNDFWTGLFTDSDTSIQGWGAITAGYNFRLTRNFSLGAQAVYSTNKNGFKNSDLQFTNRYWSVMPNAKWNWLNLRIVTLYSRAAAGISFAKAKVDGGESDTSTQFAFQVSPIGIEVGGRLAGYAEAGIGVSGSIMAGVRYRF